VPVKSVKPRAHKMASPASSRAELMRGQYRLIVVNGSVVLKHHRF